MTDSEAAVVATVVVTVVVTVVAVVGAAEWEEDAVEGRER